MSVIWRMDPRRGLKKEKLSALEMNGKPAPRYRSWFKDLERVRIALRIDSRPCYINPSSSPPPCSLRGPPALRLSPLSFASGGFSPPSLHGKPGPA